MSKYAATTTPPSASVPAPPPDATAPAPRHWLRAGWVMTASGWSANQFSALLGAAAVTVRAEN